MLRCADFFMRSLQPFVIHKKHEKQTPSKVYRVFRAFHGRN